MLVVRSATFAIVVLCCRVAHEMRFGASQNSINSDLTIQTIPFSSDLQSNLRAQRFHSSTPSLLSFFIFLRVTGRDGTWQQCPNSGSICRMEVR
jgi:hypothetical protein